jgi:hypothetical protein
VDRFHCLIAVLVLVVPSQSKTLGRSDPVIAKGSVSADAVSVYRGFFHWYSHGKPVAPELANVTYAHDAVRDLEGSDCLQGITLERGSSNTVHRLTYRVAKGTQVRMVDGKRRLATIKRDAAPDPMLRGKLPDDAFKTAFPSGVLNISEVIFDQIHSFAVMSYSFHCGSLCGGGGTLAFKRVGTSWVVSGLCETTIY